MKRFMGMMPISEVKISKLFKDNNGLIIKIEAGANGWTIIYADQSNEYCDIVDTPDNNFLTALNIVKSYFGEGNISEYDFPDGGVCYKCGDGC